MNHRKIKERLLLVSVFITGASVLIVEIVATRILSPYYGNTIYTTSSVIGIVLAALSIGYYLGGIFADKYPDYKIFYGIISLSGFLVIITQILGIILLPYLSRVLTISSGPFISSLILFLIPAFCLGMLSPFAIRLNYDKNHDKVGKQSGQIFFWSTLGSIAGSFISGFVLIPSFGINSIIFNTGSFLILWGVVNIIYNYSTVDEKIDDKSKLISVVKKFSAFIILFFILSLFFLWFSMPQKSLETLYEKDGIYEKIIVQDSIWNERPARLLMLDTSHSSAMYLESDELAFEYTKYYQIYKLFNPSPQRAFFIGGGAYSMPKDMLEDNKNVIVDVTEIEPELLVLAKKYFNLPDNDRLKTHIEDGRRFLTENNTIYDMIVSDVYYSLWSIPAHFTTKEFFTLAKARLRDNGVFVGNFAGALNENQPSFILSEMKTFMSVFPNSYFFAVDSVYSEKPQNIIFVGINGSKRIDFTSDLVLKNNNPIIKSLSEKNIDISNFDFSIHKEFTDDYSPTEYFVGKSISKWY